MELSTKANTYLATLSTEVRQGETVSDKDAFLLLDVAEQNAIAEEFAAMTEGVEGVDLVQAKAELENLPIYAVDGERGAFVLLKTIGEDLVKIPVGKSISGKLLGTRFVHSKEHKENWKKTKASDGSIRYTNSYFILENVKTGLKFGVWNMAGLRILEKVITGESIGDANVKNPLVKLDYVGLIEGRDRLQKEYGIVLTEGSSSHVFGVTIEKGCPVAQYEVGCMNPLNDPEPFVSKGEKQDKEQATKDRFAKIAAANGAKSGVTAAIAQ